MIIAHPTRRTLLGLAAALGLLPLTAFAQTDLSGVTLKIAVEKGGDLLLLQSAGLADTPYTVEPAEFASGNLVVEALAGGAIDLGIMSETPAAFAAVAGTAVRIIGVLREDLSTQAVVIPKGSAIGSIADLKGKRVGYVRATTTHFFLNNMLKEVGLGFGDITPVALSPADGLAAFNSGAIDAWAIFGLNVPYAVSSGGTVLKTAEGYLSGNTFYISNPQSLADAGKEAAIGDLLNRLQQAYRWREANLQDWARIHSEAVQIDYDLDLSVLEGATRRRDLFAISDADVASAQAVADTFLDLGVLPGKADVAPLFDRRYEAALIAGRE